MTEIEQIPLEPVDALSVTVLVDNVTDMLLISEGPARRPAIGSGPRGPVPALDLGEAFDALRAEHGFSALVSVERGGREHRLLFDTGISPDGLVENMRRLELSPRDVEAVVLSHGHFDHVGGMEGLARELGPANLPVVLHPEAWSRRWPPPPPPSPPPRRLGAGGGSRYRAASPSRSRRRAAAGWRAPASRSSNSVIRRSCSTAVCWSPARSIARPSSSREWLPVIRPITAGSGARTRWSWTIRRWSRTCGARGSSSSPAV